MSDEQRDVRTRIEVRRTLVQMRTRMINQIRAVLLGQRYQVGSGAAEHFAKRLSRVRLPPSLQAHIELLVSLLHLINAQIEQLEQNAQPRVRLRTDLRVEAAFSTENLVLTPPIPWLVLHAGGRAFVWKS